LVRDTFMVAGLGFRCFPVLAGYLVGVASSLWRLAEMARAFLDFSGAMQMGYIDYLPEWGSFAPLKRLAGTGKASLPASFAIQIPQFNAKRSTLLFRNH